MSERDIQLYLDDILDSGNAVMEYVKGMSSDDFCNDRKTYSAVVREFEIIGEAVGKLPDELKQKHPVVQWQDIKDFRNLLSMNISESILKLCGRLFKMIFRF